jgi:hypothetical protein
LAARLQNLPANGKQWLVPEEMYQTLLTNNKQGKMRVDLSIVVKIFESQFFNQAARIRVNIESTKMTCTKFRCDYIYLHSLFSVYVAGPGRSVGQPAAGQVHPLPLQSKCRLLHAGGCRKQGTMTMSSYFKNFSSKLEQKYF